MAASQALTVLGDSFYDDPSQLSQALAQRAGNEKSFHFTTSTESHPSGNAPAAFVVPLPPPAASRQPQPVVPDNLGRAPAPRRRVAAAKHVKPALPKHCSVPTSTGIVVEAHGTLKMHHTFHGMDAPGDTQPDSQIYKEWTSGIFQSTEGRSNSHNRRLLAQFGVHEDGDEDDLPSDEQENEDSSQQRNDTTITSPTIMGIDESAPIEHDSMAPTSPLKFETPAFAGRMRHNPMHLLSSAARTNTTPGTVASASAFGAAFANGGIAGGPLLSLTQIWQNTQAPTSPVVGDVNEDAVFSRPSPNFANARHSSPIPAYSSPIKAPRSDPIVRSSSEPRVEYVTMEQSQERRNLSPGDEHSAMAEEDSWGELARKVKAKKAREQFDRRTARTLSNISAPKAASPQTRKKRATTAQQPSPVRTKARRSVTYEDLHDENDSMDELSQHMSVKDLDEEDSLDESSQHVPSSTRATLVHPTDDNRILVPKTSSHPHRTPSGRTTRASSHQPTPSSQLQREVRRQGPASQSIFRDAILPRSSKDSIAIMDSQPDVTADLDSAPRPKSLRFPSSPSTNQYSINQTTMATKTGYTSQVVSSSIPPLPPRSSSAASDQAEDVSPAEEERVPSSPPLMSHDGSTHGEDIEYDEHAYDEYGEGEADQDADEPLTIDEDVKMEEDLPVAKSELIDEEGKGPRGSDADDNSDLDLVQPRKVDPATDQELPETLDREGYEKDRRGYGDEQQSATNWHTREPRLQRQNTVPETDALDETQPSFFPEPSRPVTSGDDLGTSNQTTSTEPFQTAQEETPMSQTNITVPVSSKEDGSDAMQEGDRIQSLSDIHNLPQTQQSQVEEEIEMPQLSGFGEDEQGSLHDISPGPPPAKRRRVTYAASRKTFRNPVRRDSESESLSDPPPSPPQEDVPPTASAQEREQNGALAATRAREAVQTGYTRQVKRKPTARPKPSKPQPQKKGALKPVPRELLQNLSSPANSPFKSKESRAGRESTPVTPTRPRTNVQPETDVGMPDDHDDEADELDDLTPRPVVDGEIIEVLSRPGGTPPEEILVPNRVFAAWPGSHFYPATCIGRMTARQLKIRFDDGNETFMEPAHVRALDLRTGDHVKVDEPGMKKQTYVVVGFKDKIEDFGDKQFPTTDRRGFSTIVLEEKRRDSLAPSKNAPPAERISVHMTKIYLTTQIWTRLRDRSFHFTPPESPVKMASRIGTPIADPPTTLSFTRRGTIAVSLLRDVTTRAGSATSSAVSGSGVFSNMAFVLTSTAVDVDKETIARVIKKNGGLVLEQGFHELFELDTPDLPSSQSRRRSVSVTSESASLTLKHAYSDLGFVALISDSHSRSPKYIQALALNVPCLHLRWVDDSLLASRALHFSKYLLPAGVSKFLDPNGIVRSRTMQVYDPAADDVSFAQTIQDRDLLLHSQSVLFVIGKSKKEIEKRQPFVFLMHALGSANVGRCADLAAASQMLHEEQWNWVYVDNGEKGVADAAAELFNTEKPAVGNKAKKSKKRKRDENEEKEELVARGDLAERNVRIMGSEFVIQSLILGALVEE